MLAGEQAGKRERFFCNKEFVYSVISTEGRDLRLKYNQSVKISHSVRNDNRATPFRKML